MASIVLEVLLKEKGIISLIQLGPLQDTATISLTRYIQWSNSGTNIMRVTTFCSDPQPETLYLLLVFGEEPVAEHDINTGRTHYYYHAK